MRIALLTIAAAGLLVGPAVAIADAPPKTKPTVKVRGTPPKKLKKTDIKRGTGTVVRARSWVAVRYVGVGWKTKKEFDSSWSRGREPFVVQIGKGNLIEGWERGVPGMRVGGRRRLDVPPALAYGKAGTPDGSVKANETLAFVIDLVKVCASQRACAR